MKEKILNLINGMSQDSKSASWKCEKNYVRYLHQYDKKIKKCQKIWFQKDFRIFVPVL